VAKAAIQEAPKKTRAPEHVYEGTWVTRSGGAQEVKQLFCGRDFAKVSFKIRNWEKKNLLDADFVSLAVRGDMVV